MCVCLSIAPTFPKDCHSGNLLGGPTEDNKLQKNEATYDELGPLITNTFDYLRTLYFTYFTDSSMCSLTVAFLDRFSPKLAQS